MENQQSGYESYLKEAGMVPAFHSKAVSHGKNVQATNSRAGTVLNRLYTVLPGGQLLSGS